MSQDIHELSKITLKAEVDQGTYEGDPSAAHFEVRREHAAPDTVPAHVAGTSGEGRYRWKTAKHAYSAPRVPEGKTSYLLEYEFVVGDLRKKGVITHRVWIK